MNKLFTCIIAIVINIFPASLVSGDIKVTAVGDIYVSSRMIANHRIALNNIKLNGDIVLGNFEGVVFTNNPDTDRQNFILTMPPASIEILKSIGFNTLTLANNHSMDKGISAYRDTFNQLHRNQFAVTGYDEYGTISKINGKSVRIIGFTFSGQNDLNNIQRIQHIIGNLQEDIIIVSAHMGGEGAGNCPLEGKAEYFGKQRRGEVPRFSRACIDAGADLIIGHGPHFLRGIELYKGRLICYSLGNFIFDYPGIENNSSAETCSITVNLDDTGKFKQAAITSYRIDNGVPLKDNSMAAFKRLKLCSDESGLAFHDNGIIDFGD